VRGLVFARYLNVDVWQVYGVQLRRQENIEVNLRDSKVSDRSENVFASGVRCTLLVASPESDS
jgi:hypothetical protein